MKISIWSDGDRSVGLDGFSATVDIGDFLTDNKDMRDDTRESLMRCFSELWDEKAFVVFDDEMKDVEEFDYEAKDYERG